MSDFLPWTLVVAFGCMNGGIFSAQEFVRRQERLGESRASVLMQISAGLGTVASIGTLIHYFIMAPWYWLLALFAAGVVVGALLSLLVAYLLGAQLASRILAIGWIPLAVWTNALIARL